MYGAPLSWASKLISTSCPLFEPLRQVLAGRTEEAEDTLAASSLRCVFQSLHSSGDALQPLPGSSDAIKAQVFGA